MTTGVDQEARKAAADAMHRIDKHESECALRWKAAAETMARIERAVDGLKGRLVAALLSLIGGLLVVVGVLLYGTPWGG